MNLFLIRHGESETKAASDFERGLTPKGAAVLQETVLEVAQTAGAPDLLLSSPLKRAVQTAEIFQRAWHSELQTVDWLKPNSPVGDMLKEMENLKSLSLALVGHLPSIGQILSALVWGLPPKDLALNPGAVVCLDAESFQPGASKINWILDPDLTE